MARRRAAKTEPIADEILYVPKKAFDASMPVVPNPAKKKRVRKPRSRFVVEETVVDPFGGYDDFLVKTAIIRPRGYKAADAPLISRPERTAELFKHMASYDQEHMAVMAISGNNRLLALFEAYIGGTSAIGVELKHLMKVPLLTGASAAVMVHNHPGGDPMPSPEDAQMTDVAKEGFGCINIPLVDHIIVASNGWSSVMFEGEFGRW